MRWHEYLARLSDEDHDRLLIALTLGVGHLQHAFRLHQADARPTRVLGALGAAYAALDEALDRLEVPGAGGPPSPVPCRVLGEDALPTRWRDLVDGRDPHERLRLVGALERAARAGVLARELTAADAPVAAVADELRTALISLEGVRQLATD